MGDPLEPEPLLAITERPRDEHGRAIYRDNETPPADEAFAKWRGRLTHPTAVCNHGDARRAHNNSPHQPFHCYGGWLPSGDWWLHCPICRPERCGQNQPTTTGS